MDEAQIKVIAQQLYGETPIVRHHRTSINTVYTLHFTHGTDKIFKFCADEQWKQGVLREQAVLPSLRKLRLAVSTIEYTQANAPDSVGNFSIMARDAEFSLSEYYETNPTDYSHLFAESGKWLAKLHSIDPSAVEGIMSADDALVAGIRERRHIYDSIIAADMMKADYYPLFQRFEKIQRQARTDLIHGDFNASQVMVDAKKLAYVVDWDATQYGRAMRDLGLCLAYTKFYNRAVREAPMLQAAYEALRPLSDSERHECLHWELYTLLRITANAIVRNAESQAHWGKKLIQNVYLKII